MRPDQCNGSEGGSEGAQCCSRCSFSFDGFAWQDATAPEEGGLAVGPLVCEPGWDFYDVLPPVGSTPDSAENPSPVVLHVRRTTPLRLIRVYSEWPTNASPLGAALRPEGVGSTSVTLPAYSVTLPRLLVAVCPPTASLGQAGSKPAGSSLLSSRMVLDKGISRPSPPVVVERRGSGSGVSGGGGGMSSSSTPQRHSLRVATASTEPAFASPSRRRGLLPTNGLPQTSSHPHSSAKAAPSASPAAPMSASEAHDGVDGKLQRELADLRAQLEEQRRVREAAEAEALFFCSQASELREEREQLRSKLRNAERTNMASEMQVRAMQSEVAKAKLESQRASRQPRQGRPSVCAPQSLDDVVAALVSLELKPLFGCSAEERSAAKKKLLLRWHPDKNGGTGAGACSDLSKRITQELQSRPEWNM